ncbi:hypothetical protein AB0I81_34735 [Nonomuraea sp. NPDC050404]|uniref:hypothetical protein n=1 Tax=Nonomuraea sp. NPDC050404 TaxID=3155783 RepID=UPI0034065BB3
MLTETEPSDPLDTELMDLQSVLQKTAMAPGLAERLLVLLREIFPKWEIFLEDHTGAVMWCATLRRDVTIPMQNAGVIRTHRYSRGTKLATALAHQLEILARFDTER